MSTRRPILSIFFIISFSISAQAQWSKVASDVLGDYSLVYGGAMTYSDGVVWAGFTSLFKSLDSGKTWSSVDIPFNDLIMDINFKNKDTGIVALYGQGAIYTADGGNNWQIILSVNECLGASFARNGKEIFVGDRNNLVGTISYTSDAGQSWSRQQVESDGGVYQTQYDPIRGIAYALSRSTTPYKSRIQVSTDFGQSWSMKSGDVDLDSYSFVVDSCDQNRLYISNEQFNEIENDKSEIYTTSNGGTSWRSTINGPQGYFSSSIASSYHAVYAETSTGDGVFRSTDKGESWKLIGGPSMHPDTRLLCAINDNIILAADDNGNIWRTDNSGGDSIISASTSPIEPFSFSSARQIKDSLNITIWVPIYLHHQGSVPAVQMAMHYQPATLTYKGSFLRDGTPIDIAGSTYKGRSVLSIPASGLNNLPDSLVGYAVFNWYAYEQDCQQIVFDSIVAVIPPVDCEPQTTVPQPGSFSGFIGTFSLCGTFGVAERLAPTAAPAFVARPNPTTGVCSINSSEYSGGADITVYDESGRTVISQQGYISPSQGVALRLTDLAEGVYTVTIACGGRPAYELRVVREK